MSSQQWSFDQPDRFIVGTIGAPGEREFYFQIRQKNILISLATEKSQATALAEIEISFRAEDADSLGDEADDDDSGPIVEIHLDLSMALAFAQRTMALVAAGRPLCPFCISPIDPRGHLCPRANGYRR